MTNTRDIINELMLAQADLEEESHVTRFTRGDAKTARDLEMQAKGVKVAIDMIVSRFGIE